VAGDEMAHHLRGGLHRRIGIEIAGANARSRNSAQRV
jgi:hypothetical protein